MAIKVKAVERKLKFTKDENDPGVYRYVLGAELYTALSQKKVIKEAALRSGVAQGVMQACWDAAGEVIKAWATEGHSVAIPGLGTMRFGVRGKAVEDVNDVKSGLITARRIIFTPNTDLKDELKATQVQITCYDRNGDVVKRVTSEDDAEVEDNTNTNENANENQNQNQSGSGSGSGSGSNTNDTNNTNSGSESGSGSGDNSGSGSGSGDNSGSGSGSGDNSGSGDTTNPDDDPPANDH